LPASQSKAPPQILIPFAYPFLQPPNPAHQTELKFRQALDDARRWQQGLRSGQFKRLREIAAKEAITVARVSQLLTLNRISPESLRQIQQKAAAQRRRVSIRLLLRFARKSPNTRDPS
jgi:hypothetical protein